MKSFFTVIILFLALTVSGQNYQLFNASAKKVYKTASELTKTLSLEFDSVVSQGSNIAYYPYKSVGENGYSSDTCYHWGGDCYFRDFPNWIGSHINDSGDVYEFVANSDSVLNFNFNLSPLQAHIFYEDNIQRFSISRVTPGIDTMNLLGTTDSVIKFQISHTDLQGNFINSALNTWEIIIGKQFGLINFFRIDSFPVVLEPLTLMGNINPNAGFYQLTNAIIYNYSPGDKIQYHEYYRDPLYPELNSDEYTTDNFIERRESSDSLKYKVFREVYNPDSPSYSSDTVWLQYRKDVVIAEVPYDWIDSEILYYSDLFKDDYCGLDLWTYQSGYSGRYLEYCEIENSWCSFDVFGISDSDKTYTEGLGLYYAHYGTPGPATNSYGGYNMNYFKKGSLECGDQVVGINDLPSVVKRICISPNPAAGSFTITGNFIDSDLILTDVNGRIVLKLREYRNGGTIDISNLTSGIYLVRLIDGTTSMNGKLIVR